MIDFDCPSCGKRLQADDKYAEKKGRCNGCGNMLIVPNIKNIPVHVEKSKQVPLKTNIPDVKNEDSMPKSDDEKHCTECGQSIASTIKYCPACGKQISNEAPNMSPNSKNSSPDVPIESDGFLGGRSLEQSSNESPEMQAEAKAYYKMANSIHDTVQLNTIKYGHNSSLRGIPTDVPLALQYIDRSLEYFPDNPIYLNLKAMLLWEGIGDKTNALPLLEKAASLDPRNITIQNNLKALKAPQRWWEYKKTPVDDVTDSLAPFLWITIFAIIFILFLVNPELLCQAPIL